MRFATKELEQFVMEMIGNEYIKSDGPIATVTSTATTSIEGTDPVVSAPRIFETGEEEHSIRSASEIFENENTRLDHIIGPIVFNGCGEGHTKTPSGDCVPEIKTQD